MPSFYREYKTKILNKWCQPKWKVHEKKWVSLDMSGEKNRTLNSWWHRREVLKFRLLKCKGDKRNLKQKFKWQESQCNIWAVLDWRLGIMMTKQVNHSSWISDLRSISSSLPDTLNFSLVPKSSAFLLLPCFLLPCKWSRFFFSISLFSLVPTVPANPQGSGSLSLPK